MSSSSSSSERDNKRKTGPESKHLLGKKKRHQPYQIFSRILRRELLQRNPGISAKDIAKDIKHTWQSLNLKDYCKYVVTRKKMYVNKFLWNKYWKRLFQVAEANIRRHN